MAKPVPSETSLQAPTGDPDSVAYQLLTRAVRELREGRDTLFVIPATQLIELCRRVCDACAAEEYLRMEHRQIDGLLGSLKSKP